MNLRSFKKTSQLHSPYTVTIIIIIIISPIISDWGWKRSQPRFIVRCCASLVIRRLLKMLPEGARMSCLVNYSISSSHLSSASSLGGGWDTRKRHEWGKRRATLAKRRAPVVTRVPKTFPLLGEADNILKIIAHSSRSSCRLTFIFL